MAAIKTSRDTRRRFAHLKAEELSRFIEQVAEESRDANLLRYLYVLFLKMYEMEMEGRYMTKSQACRFIPLKHAASCAKYLEEAKSAGYVYFETDEIDRRKSLVKPSKSLLAFVEAEVDRSIAATLAMVRELPPIRKI